MKKYGHENSAGGSRGRGGPYEFMTKYIPSLNLKEENINYNLVSLLMNMLNKSLKMTGGRFVFIGGEAPLNFRVVGLGRGD